MGDLTLKGATSGQITLTPTAVAGTNTLTLPAKTGNIITSADSGTVTQAMLASNVAGNGPAFGVYGSSSQTGLSSGAYTKIVFNTEEFDTNSNFDAVTNYRFTPTVAGYYQINLTAYITATNISGAQLLIYKNGSAFKVPQSASYTSTGAIVGGGCIVSMNGSSDYLEFYAFGVTSSGTYTINASQALTFVNGCLVRAS